MATKAGPQRDGRVQGFSTTDLLPFADGVAPSTLNHWVAKEFVIPTLLASDGRQRATRYWSIEDAVIVRAIYRLRRWRAPDEVLQTIGEEIRKSNRGGTLRWAGKNVVELLDDIEVDVAALPGQISFASEVFHLATIPLGTWFDEAENAAKWYDIEVLTQRRVASAERRGIVDGNARVVLEDEHLRSSSAGSESGSA